MSESRSSESRSSKSRTSARNTSSESRGESRSSVRTKNEKPKASKVKGVRKDIPMVDMNDPIAPYIAAYNKGEISAKELSEKIDAEIIKQKEAEEKNKLKSGIDSLIKNYESAKTKDFTNIRNMEELSKGLKEMIGDEKEMGDDGLR